MGNIARFGAALGIAAGVGTAAAVTTSWIQGAGHARWHAEGGDATNDQKQDGLAFNFDGDLRLGLGALALASVPVAGALALAGKRGIAAPVLGAGLGVAAAGLLAGNGGSISANVNSAGNALNAWIHSSFRPTQPKVADHLPKSTEDPAPAAKPTAEEARSIQLTHLPGTADMERAKRDAQKTLESLDFSKRDLVIWVPGTGNHDLSRSWKDGVDRTFGDRASQAYVDYPAEWDIAPSAATGMETLKLVLAGIAERGGDHRVMLAGHSQGAWVIGDVMAEPKLRALVDRAVLFGHPGMSAVDYADGHDPKVVEVNDGSDPITYPVEEQEKFLSGMDQATRGSKLLAVPDLLDVALANPGHGAYFGAKILDPKRWHGDEDPHQYADEFQNGARWLDAGAV